MVGLIGPVLRWAQLERIGCVAVLRDSLTGIMMERWIALINARLTVRRELQEFAVVTRPDQ